MNAYNPEKPIIIECAMRSEANLILAAMSNVRESSILSYPVYEGTIKNSPVVLACNKVGMINAAALTMALLDRYGPKCLISEGTAGAYSDSLRTNDLILADRIYNVNGIHMTEQNCAVLEQLTLGEWRRNISFPSAEALLDLAGSIPYPYGRVIRGGVGSADFWSFEKGQIHEITGRYPALCEDMESFAEAQVCSLRQTDFLCVRILSNNELTGESFDPASAEKCQEFVLHLIEKL